MIRLIIGALLALVGWLGPTLPLIQTVESPTTTVSFSVNQVNALCSSVFGQMGQALSPTAHQYCSEASTAGIAATICILAGVGLIIWGLLPRLNIEVRRGTPSR